jgi:hypothetical protein
MSTHSRPSSSRSVPSRRSTDRTCPQECCTLLCAYDVTSQILASSEGEGQIVLVPYYRPSRRTFQFVAIVTNRSNVAAMIRNALADSAK